MMVLPQTLTPFPHQATWPRSERDFAFVNSAGSGYQVRMNETGFRGPRDQGGADETIVAAEEPLLSMTPNDRRY